MVLALPSLRTQFFGWFGVTSTVTETGKTGSDVGSGQNGYRLQGIETKVTGFELRLLALETGSASDKQEVQVLKEQLKGAIAEVMKSNELLAEQKKQWEIALQQEATVQATVGNSDVLSTSSTISTGTASSINTGKSSSTGKKGAFIGKVNINTANATELHNLSGIGPAFAQRIITYRNKKGAFHQVSELLNVKGIKQKELDKIKDSIVF